MTKLQLFAFWFGLAFLSTPQVHGQSQGSERFVARGETVEALLNRWVQLFDKDLIYNPEVDLSEELYIDMYISDPNEVLNRILRRTSFDYLILSTGTYVIIKRAEITENYGEFFGFVYDEETGEPVENATILLADASNSTTTNRQGYFSVSPLTTGSYPVIISSVGYKAIAKEIRVDTSNNVNIIKLSPKIFTGDPIIVQGTADRFIQMRWLQEMSISQAENIFADASTNPLRSLTALPAVSMVYGSQSMSIQGSNPSEMTVLLDGVPMYNAFRATDLTGMFSPFAIDKIDIRQMPTSVGDRHYAFGSVNFLSDNNDRIADRTLLAEINPNSLNGRAEIPLKNWSTSLSFRSDWLNRETPYGYEKTYREWNQFDPLIQNFLMGGAQDIASYEAGDQQTELHFADFHLSSVYKINEFESLAVSGYVGVRTQQSDLFSNRVSFSTNQPDVVYSNERSETSNLMLKTEYFKVLNAKADLNFQAFYTQSSHTYSYLMASEHDLNPTQAASSSVNDELVSLLSTTDPMSDAQDVQQGSIKFTFSNYLNSRNTLTTGVELDFFSNTFELKDIFYFPLSTNSSNQLADLFIKHKVSINQNFSVRYGMRTTFSSANKQWYAQPQFSIDYHTNRTLLGFQSFQLKSGIHRQFIQQFEIANVGPNAIAPFNRFNMPIDASLSAPILYQTTFDWTIQPATSSVFTLSAYYKNQPTQFNIDYTQLLATPGNSSEIYRTQNDFLERSSFYAYGASVTFRHEFSDPSLLVQLIQQSNISIIEYDKRFNGRAMQTSWSEPYSTSGTLNWQANSSVSLVLNMKWIPKRYWGFNRSYYDFLTTHDQSTFGDYSITSPTDDVLPDYFRADIGININTAVNENWNTKFRLTLQNITNRRNAASFHLEPYRNDNQEIKYRKHTRSLPGFIPMLSAQFDF